MHRDLGPVVRFGWFSQQVVSVADPILFKKLAPVFDRAESLFEAFSPLIGTNSIQYANGNEGKQRYKVFAKSFNRQALASYDELLFKVIDDELRAYVTSNQSEVVAQELGMKLSLRGKL